MLCPDCLANFLIGEGKLESFLEEVPPLEANVAKARFGLIEVKRFLNVAVTKVRFSVTNNVFNYVSSRLMYCIYAFFLAT